MFADAHIYLGVALAGLVSFLSPCVLPLVPPYLIYLGGSSIEQMNDEDGMAQEVWLRTVLASVFFAAMRSAFDSSRPLPASGRLRVGWPSSDT